MGNRYRKAWLWWSLAAIAVVLLAVYAGGQAKVFLDDYCAGLNAAPAINYGTDAQPLPAGTRAEAPGANPINEANQVVTWEGQPTDNSVAPIDDNAPKPTLPIEKSQVAAEAIKLNISKANGFTPKRFTVSAGEPTTVALTAADASTHMLKFDDPSLNAVALLVGPGETKAITFNAPTTPGEYTFRCDVPGHAEAGEVGVMVVE